MIIPDTPVETSSSNIGVNLQKAYEVTSEAVAYEEVTLESPQQQPPTPQIPQPIQLETIPESVIETVVEPSVSVSDSEPIRNQTISVFNQPLS
jgi:hypothetical protein